MFVTVHRLINHAPVMLGSYKTSETPRVGEWLILSTEKGYVGSYWKVASVQHYIVQETGAAPGEEVSTAATVVSAEESDGAYEEEILGEDA